MCRRRSRLILAPQQREIRGQLTHAARGSDSCPLAVDGSTTLSGPDCLAAWIPLQSWILEFSRRTPVQRDRKYRDQLTDAGSGICRNVAEGFARWTHRDFHNSLRVAMTCPKEVESVLTEAVLRPLPHDRGPKAGGAADWTVREGNLEAHEKSSRAAGLRRTRPTRDKSATPITEVAGPVALREAGPPSASASA